MQREIHRNPQTGEIISHTDKRDMQDFYNGYASLVGFILGWSIVAGALAIIWHCTIGF